ncbi:MAG: trigger factor [Candidatus Rhabdochlamydia sp.]
MENTVSTPSVLEFSNETLKVKAHFKPFCKVELEVEADPSLVKEAHAQAVKRVGKEVVIPGFRKGKAPAHFVEQNYPKPIESELQKTLSELSFKQALDLTKIPVLNNEFKISYSVKECSLETGATLTLFFETEATIPTIDPSSLKLKAVERPLVNEEKVNETIRQALLFFADWASIHDRPVQEGDFVLLDVDVVEENSLSPLFSKVRFEVTDKSMAAWMKTLILGHSIGEVLEGVSTPDVDASVSDQEELTPKNVKVTIHAIETATTPELSDEWAQKLGSQSVEDLRVNVEKLLNSKADAHVKEKLREQVSELFLTNYPFEVPESLTEREVKFRMQQLLQDTEYLKHWNQMPMNEKKQVIVSISEQSVKAVRMFYLCRKLLADAKISLSPSHSDHEENTTLLDVLLGDYSKDEYSGNPETREAENLSKMLFEKAEDYVIANAIIE